MDIYGKCKYFDCFSRMSELPFRMLGEGIRTPKLGRMQDTVSGRGALANAQRLSVSLSLSR